MPKIETNGRKFRELDGSTMDVFQANRARSRAYHAVENEIEFLAGCNEDVRIHEKELRDIIFDAMNKVDTEVWLNTTVEPPLTTIQHALEYLKRYD